MDDPFPFRKIYPSPLAEASPLGVPYSHRIEEDLQKIYLEEVDAVSASAPAGADRLGRLEHQHKIFSQRNRTVALAFQKRASEVKLKTDLRLDRNAVAKIRRAMDLHPVVGKPGLLQYDPLRKVGFCFGRAAYGHLELSRRGVSHEAMVKVFAFGKLVHTGMLWSFHMATAVLGSDGKGHAKWWVVDSLFARTYDIEEWIRKVTAFSVSKKFSDVRIYATDPRKFLPSSGEYNKKDLSLAEYNGYFENLYRSFSKARL